MNTTIDRESCRLHKKKNRLIENWQLQSNYLLTVEMLNKIARFKDGKNKKENYSGKLRTSQSTSLEYRV